MLRYSSQPFTFHVLPAPQPPHSVFSPFPREPYGGGAHNGSPSILDNGPAAGSSGGGNGGGSGPYLWEGFGTLVLVSKTDVTDRAMVIEVRPPDVLDAGVMRELAKGRREWWHLPTELCAGDVGQANLLQAQVRSASLPFPPLRTELTVQPDLRRLRAKSSLLFRHYESQAVDIRHLCKS